MAITKTRLDDGRVEGRLPVAYDFATATMPTPNNYVVDYSAYGVHTALEVGREYRVLIQHDSTGPATLNVDGLGSFPVVKFVDQDLSIGDLKVGQMSTFEWDGSKFQLTSVFPSLSGVQGSELTTFAAESGSKSDIYSPSYKNLGVGGAMSIATTFQKSAGSVVFPNDVYVDALVWSTTGLATTGYNLVCEVYEGETEPNLLQKLATCMSVTTIFGGGNGFFEFMFDDALLFEGGKKYWFVLTSVGTSFNNYAIRHASGTVDGITVGYGTYSGGVFTPESRSFPFFVRSTHSMVKFSNKKSGSGDSITLTGSYLIPGATSRVEMDWYGSSKTGSMFGQHLATSSSSGRFAVIPYRVTNGVSYAGSAVYFGPGADAATAGKAKGNGYSHPVEFGSNKRLFFSRQYSLATTATERVVVYLIEMFNSGVRVSLVSASPDTTSSTEGSAYQYAAHSEQYHIFLEYGSWVLLDLYTNTRSVITPPVSGSFVAVSKTQGLIMSLSGSTLTITPYEIVSGGLVYGSPQVVAGFGAFSTAVKSSYELFGESGLLYIGGFGTYLINDDLTINTTNLGTPNAMDCRGRIGVSSPFFKVPYSNNYVWNYNQVVQPGNNLRISSVDLQKNWALSVNTSTNVGTITGYLSYMSDLVAFAMEDITIPNSTVMNTNIGNIVLNGRKTGQIGVFATGKVYNYTAPDIMPVNIGVANNGFIY